VLRVVLRVQDREARASRGRNAPAATAAGRFRISRASGDDEPAAALPVTATARRPLVEVVAVTARSQDDATFERAASDRRNRTHLTRGRSQAGRPPASGRPGKLVGVAARVQDQQTWSKRRRRIQSGRL
jgi:hypothetical protein